MNQDKLSNNWHVYILRCAGGKRYIGCTGNLKQRMKAHEQGKVHFTKSQLPVELVTYIPFSEKYKAFKFEKFLKAHLQKIRFYFDFSCLQINNAKMPYRCDWGKDYRHRTPMQLAIG